MRWFGKSWGAPICDVADHAPTPTGQPCAYCKRPIAEGDHGSLVPHVDQVFDPILAEGARVLVFERPWHLDCLLRSVGVAQPERVVHVLLGGRSLCGLEGLGGPLPCHWPAGHVHVSIDDDPGLVTCATCRGELARRRSS